MVGAGGAAARPRGRRTGGSHSRQPQLVPGSRGQMPLQGHLGGMAAARRGCQGQPEAPAAPRDFCGAVPVTAGERRGTACPPRGHTEAPWGHLQAGPTCSPLPSAPAPAPRSLCSGFMPLQSPPRTTGPDPRPAGRPGPPAPHTPRSPLPRTVLTHVPGRAQALLLHAPAHAAPLCVLPRVPSPVQSSPTLLSDPLCPHARTPWAATSPPPSTPSHFRQVIPPFPLAGPSSALRSTLLCWVIPTGPPPYHQCTLGSLPAPPRTPDLSLHPLRHTLGSLLPSCSSSILYLQILAPHPAPCISSLHAFHHGQGPSSPSKPHRKVQINSPLRHRAAFQQD